VGPTRNFDIPSIAPGGFFDVFMDYPLAVLPPSAPTSDTPPVGTPCAPQEGWNGNVHVTWNTPGGVGQAFRHMGQLLVCPGAACSFIHVETGCAAAAPWAISGLSPGFHATLFEEDRVTPAPNPVPSGWHGWLCIRADAVVPVPTTSCLALQFDCAGQPGIVELCVTTCDCDTPANPVPGTIGWQTQPDGNTVRFHVRWTNPDTQPSGPIQGEMFSQDFGVFRPDFGAIGSFSVPALAPGSFFDVFTDVALQQLPPSANKSGGPGPNAPCPPVVHWDGNVDLHWTGAAGPGSAEKHIGEMLVCPGSGASLMHIGVLDCDPVATLPWSVAGGCPGFHITLVENDGVTPAPNPVPPGHRGCRHAGSHDVLLRGHVPVQRPARHHRPVRDDVRLRPERRPRPRARHDRMVEGAGDRGCPLPRALGQPERERADAAGQWRHDVAGIRCVPARRRADRSLRSSMCPWTRCRPNRRASSRTATRPWVVPARRTRAGTATSTSCGADRVAVARSTATTGTSS
jgi:hypothetical protein